MKKVVIIDGQGGRLGQLLVEAIKATALSCDLYAIGTNSSATSAMMKAGADFGATGENPVVVACRDADVIIGPIGIISAPIPKNANSISEAHLRASALPQRTAKRTYQCSRAESEQD